jgi:hypothetical protein
MSILSAQDVHLVAGLKRSRPATLLLLLAVLPVHFSHAAQQLSDAELDYRYIQVDARHVLLAPTAATSNTLELSQVMYKNPVSQANLDTLHTMLGQQNYQLSAGVLGTQANSQKAFDNLVVSNIGSERYSFRWAGNLQDVVQIGDISSLVFSLNGITDVEIVNLDSNIGLELNVHRY